MNETCKVDVSGLWSQRTIYCGEPAKETYEYRGENIPRCGVHLAAAKRSRAASARRSAKWEASLREREQQAALSAARDELVRAAVALAPDIAAEHPDASGYRVVNITERDAAAFCAAVAALARLEKP